MIMKTYEILVKTATFKYPTDQKKFVTKFIKFINDCNYKKIPATMIPVNEEKVSVVNNTFTSAKVSVEVTIVKPENESKILDKIYRIEDKLPVELVHVNLIKQI